MGADHLIGVTNSGAGETTLRIMLLDDGGSIIARDFRKVSLPETVPPASTVKFEFEVDGSHANGRFVLHFDMVHERVCWFSDLKPNYLDIPLEIMEYP